MARPMYASILPTIKCSDCGIELAISMMADHICDARQGAADTPRQHTNHERIPPPPTLLAPTTFERPRTRNTKHNRTYTPQHRLNMSRSFTLDVGGSTSSTKSSPSPPPSLRPRNPLRSLTDPFNTNDEIKISQDSAFPIFPTKRKPANLSLSTTNGYMNTGPLSPNSAGGANVLKRMDTITSGPFSAGRRKEFPRSPTRPDSGDKEAKQEKAPSIQDDRLAAGQSPPRPKRPETDDSLLEQLQNASLGGSPLPLFDDRPGLTISPPPSATTAGAQEQWPLVGPAIASSIPPVEEAPVHVEEEELKPLPNFAALHSQAHQQHNHSSVSSESSFSSRSGFDSRTESSRSSNSNTFLLISPTDSQHKLSSTDQEITQLSPVEEHFHPVAETATRHTPSDSTSREEAFGALSPLLVPAALTPTKRDPPVGGPLLPLISPPLESPMGERTPGLAPKPAKRSKGDCRGCSKPIFGKSIKAADGRLTGRYHKECFVCHTCKANFETAEFYVLNNNPYCAHHYHVLNHSLCYKCNKGIEGQYLETAPRRRYHLDCFACNDCGRSLTSDYYEINSRFYCEADAYRVHEKSQLLAPGKKFPDRRMTRLMEM